MTDARREPAAGRPGPARPTSGRPRSKSWRQPGHERRPAAGGPRRHAGRGGLRPGRRPGAPPGGGLPPGEHVGVPLAGHGLGARWRPELAGQGHGRRSRPRVRWPAARRRPDRPVARFLAAAVQCPAVVDADGLPALGDLDPSAGRRKARARTVLTPHEGEFARLVGGPRPTTASPTCGTWPPNRGGGVAKGLARPSWPTPAGGCWSSTGLVPPGHGRHRRRPVRVSSPPFWPGACPPLERPPWRRTVHGRAASLGRARVWWRATCPIWCRRGCRASPAVIRSRSDRRCSPDRPSYGRRGPRSTWAPSATTPGCWPPRCARPGCAQW